MKDIVKAVRGLDVVVDMNDYLDDLHTMTKSNCIRELKKPADKRRRHPDTIAEHTAQGMAPEKALEAFNFMPTAPIVEDPDKLKFADVKSDSRFDGNRVEIKSMSKDTEWYSLGESQLDSIRRAVPYNDYFLIMLSEKMEDLKYHVRPRFLVDASKIMWYIKPSQHKKNSYYFNHRAARSDGFCVDFKELAHV